MRFILIFSALLLAPLAYSADVVEKRSKTQEGQLEFRSAGKQTVPVSINYPKTNALSTGVKGSVSIQITPSVDVESMTVEIMGVDQVAVVDKSRARFTDVAAGQTIERSVPVLASESGRHYLRARVMVSPKDGLAFERVFSVPVIVDGVKSAKPSEITKRIVQGENGESIISMPASTKVKQ